MAVRNEKVIYEFTAENSKLAKTVEKNIQLLDRYSTYLSAFAQNSLAATDKEMESLSKHVKQVTAVSTQLKHVFGDFQRQVDKFSTGFNWVDEAIRKQEKLAKSAKESADVFKQAYAEQNRFNAGSRGAVNVDAPSKSASDSAAVFNQFFTNQDTKLGSVLSKLAQVGTRFAHMNGVISSSSASAAALGSKLHPIVAVLTSIFQVVKKLTPIVLKITKTISKFVLSPLTLLHQGFSKLSNSVSGATGAIQNFNSVIGVGVGAGLGAYLGSATTNASDMTEAMNLFNVVMKDGLEAGNRWLFTLSEMSGMDATNLMSITGLFYEMGAAVEMPHEAASKLSKDLTTLSLDISSLFNVDLETVTDNLTSGIRGMSRAVVKYGMDVRASTVEAFAKANFQIQEQYETMNETNRIILRYLVMLEQAQDSNGDFAATIEAPANQLRVFKQQVLSLSRELGRFVVHVLAPMLPILNGITMALRHIVKFIADLFSIWNGVSTRTYSDATEDISDGITGIGSSATDATKKLQNFLAPFDELNVIAEQASSMGDAGAGFSYGEADPELLRALEEAETRFGRIEMAATRARDAVLEFFGFKYIFDPANGIDEYLELIPGGFADQLIQAFEREDFESVGRIIAEKLNPVVQSIASKLSWDNIGPAIRQNLGAVITSLNSFIATLDWFSVGAIFGNLLKTTFETINFALLAFDWTALGAALANSLIGFFNAFDITLVGETLAHVLESIANFASGFATEFDWLSFGDNLSGSINRFFATFDATKFGATANSIITKLLTMLNEAIATTDWKLVADKIAAFLDALNWVEILQLLGQTIWSALKAAIMMALEGAIGRHGAGISSAVDNAYAPIMGGAAMATGGVVTGPTRALIGEAGRSEAVIPLDNSPQMEDLISKIANRVSGQETVVKVYIGDREWDAFTFESAQRGSKLVGAQPVMVGG